MAITKLLSFEAEAEVLGRIHTVHFVDNELTITGLTLADAHEVLNALSTGKLASAEVPRGNGEEEYDFRGGVRGKYAGRVNGDTPHPAVMAGAPIPQVVTTPAPPPPPAPVEEAEFGDAPPVGAASVEEDPFGPPAAPSVLPRVPAPPPGPAAPPPSTDGLPDALAKAKTVVGALHALALSEGCKDIDALIAAAVKVKDRVPALRVVVNLEDRVRRTVEAHPEKVWPAS